MAGKFVVRADGGNGYYAVAGKRGADSATTKDWKATAWATRGEAEAALPAIAEAAPGFFGERQNAAVVDLTPAPKPAAPASPAPAVECLECGSRFPSHLAHLVDAGGMGCARCNH